MPTCETYENDADEVVDYNTSRTLFPMAPLLPRRQHRLLLYIKPEPSLWFAQEPSIEAKDGTIQVRTAGESVQRPVNATIKVSLIRRNSIKNVVRKGKLGSPDFMTLLGS